MPPLDTFEAIVGDVHAHALGVDSSLIEGWVRDTWSEIERQRTWSHLRRQYQIAIPTPYTIGTATLTPASNLVTLVTGVVSTSFIGRQFQRAVGEPIHEIVSVDTTANTLTIFPEWSYTSTQVTGQSYRVFTAYISPPQDFYAWVSVRDPERRRRLNVWMPQDTLDRADPSRTLGSRPACLSGIDWSRAYGGRTYSAVVVTQSAASPTPIIGGSYNGQADGLLLIRITATGALDAATFTYATDAATPATLTVSSSGNSLANGVELTWPAGTYTAGTVYAIRVTSNAQVTVPRYELYPHPQEAMVLVGVYSTRPTDPETTGWIVPPPLTGDIIKLGALDLMARAFPGTREKPNPFAQIARSTELRDRFIEAVIQCMTLDESIIPQNVTQMEDSWPWAALPWPWSGSRTEDTLPWP